MTIVFYRNGSPADVPGCRIFYMILDSTLFLGVLCSYKATDLI